MIESRLPTSARIYTFAQQRMLTNASGIFFERDERFFLVTRRRSAPRDVARSTCLSLSITLSLFS